MGTGKEVKLSSGPIKRMRIGYCSFEDPHDQRSWSGITYNVFRTLGNFCGDVHPLGPIHTKGIILGRIINTLSRITTGKKLEWRHSKFLAKQNAKKLKFVIGNAEYDLYFFCSGSDLLAYSDLKGVPVVYFSDTTFDLMVDYYPGYTKLLSKLIKSGREIEKRSIDRADLILYTSKWAADSAVRNYHCERNKISVIPCGVNLDKVPSYSEIQNSREKDQRILKLLFSGLCWERKGGDIAFKTMIELNRRGLHTELFVVGCQPPRQIRDEKLKVMGFLNKNDPEKRIKYQQLFINSSIFLLPTRAECFGLVFCEASAFGLPIISTDTGGVSDYVENGVSGYLLPIQANYLDYADLIQSIWSDKDRYARLCENSRNKYEKELNWDIWGEKAKDAITKAFFRSKNKDL